MKKVIYSSIILIGIILNGCSGGGSDTGSVNEVSADTAEVKSNIDVAAPEQVSRFTSLPPIPQMPVDD